ncbi:hypothetical protein L1987_11077 [Smallanthus sonchifolius]|uniref:Uncharacterized protein n=1 Tax=Smallanthus sonchifolius TaxID=185202 RepID=A0ACB9JBG7_9ASTR|nr:hypothetical protein L1987_11077 [Smallanthus sonchifolius]
MRGRSGGKEVKNNQSGMEQKSQIIQRKNQESVRAKGKKEAATGEWTTAASLTSDDADDGATGDRLPLRHSPSFSLSSPDEAAFLCLSLFKAIRNCTSCLETCTSHGSEAISFVILYYSSYKSLPKASQHSKILQVK